MEKQLKGIEIPFGAKDSELCGWEYTIPEGMEATIVDNKIVVQKKESEDERIIKAIKSAVLQLTDIYLQEKYGLKQSDCLAWLEKQGEKGANGNEMEIPFSKQKSDSQNSTDWSVSDFRTWQYIVSDVLTKKDGIGQHLDSGECKKIAKYMQEEWGKRLSTEQKPAELPKGEDYGIDGLYSAIDILQKTLCKVEGYETDDGILEHKCAISAVKQLAKQKSSWSEEDEKELSRVIYMMEQLDLTESWSDCYAFLNSLKDRVQPKQEWSEDDMATISRVISIVKWAAYSDHSHPILNDEGATELVERLKSLKDRYTWKPSEAQLEALANALSLAKNCGEECAFDLRTLYEQLKKLKEE